MTLYLHMFFRIPCLSFGILETIVLATFAHLGQLASLLFVDRSVPLFFLFVFLGWGRIKLFSYCGCRLPLITDEQQQTLMCVTSCSVSSYCTLVINFKWRRREKKDCGSFLLYFSFTAATGFALLCGFLFYYISQSSVGHHILGLYSTYSSIQWWTKPHTSWMWFTSFSCFWFAGLRSSGRHAGPARPHQLHAPAAASPPLHVPLIVSVPHPAAGLQPIPSRHRRSEVSASRHTGSIYALQSQNRSNPKPWWIVNSNSRLHEMIWVGSAQSGLTKTKLLYCSTSTVEMTWDRISMVVHMEINRNNNQHKQPRSFEMNMKHF